MTSTSIITSANRTYYWNTCYMSINITESLYVGYFTDTIHGGSIERSAFKFPLTTMPIGANISNVQLVINVTNVTGIPITDIHPYNGNGQADIEIDDCNTFLQRCSPLGIPYVANINIFQSVGVKTIPLGNNAINDIIAAKSTVNQFSISLHDINEISGNEIVIQTHTANLIISYTCPTLVSELTIP